MNTFRSWSRRAWLLHGYLITSFFLMGPVPVVNSYWTDSDNNRQKEWVHDPSPEDVAWWEADTDGDYLSNAQEVVFGSDPYRIDADFDGLTDLVEKNYYDPTQTLDSWNWDSDGDGYSDHDEYYQYVQSYIPVVHYPSLGGVFYSYYDADGDGVHNQNDNDPVNMDRDGDTIVNWLDSYPDDPNNGNNGGGSGGSPPDSDNDGIPDDQDPFPWGSYWHNGVEYGGTWVDSDNDGIPDPADSTPNGTYWYNNVEYPGSWTDQDNDGIPDPADPWPGVPGSYIYNGSEYPGSWTDQDNDGIPNTADPFPELPGSYWWNGAEYGGPMPDQDGDGIPDFADPPDPGPSYWYMGVEYSGVWTDSDGDTVPDPADTWPTIAGSFWYSGTEYPGAWVDSDSDSVPDPVDAFPNGSYVWNGTEYPGVMTDNDSDGIPNEFDAWPNSKWNGEPFYEYNGVEYGGYWADRDSDGIPDPADEWPDDSENNLDSDHDGLSNYSERTVFLTNPDKVDTDDDFLSDYEELHVTHTDPLNPITDQAGGQVLLDGYLFLGQDTDEDGLPDLLEDYYAPYGLDRNNPADAALDLDNDGYTNLQAYQYGWSLNASYHLSYDMDEDGIPDAVEDAWHAIDQNLMSSLNADDAVADPDNDGVMNFEEIRLGLKPGSAHTREQSVTDLQEMVWRQILLAEVGNQGGNWHGPPITVPTDWHVMTDANSNGIPDGLDAFVTALAANPAPVALPQRIALGDYDGDGMPDTWEHRIAHRQYFNLRDASDGPPNFDNDRLSNVEEYQQGRHPLIADDPPLQLLTTSLPPNGLLGVAYNAPPAQATGGVPPYSYSTYPDVPNGLTFDNSNGAITGIPNTEGSWAFGLTVTDQIGNHATREFAITIGREGDPPPDPLEIHASFEVLRGKIATAYSAQLSSSGGVGLHTYAVTGTLPDGLSFDPITARITGTPNTPGGTDVVLSVTDAAGSTASTLQQIWIDSDLEITFTPGIFTSVQGKPSSFGVFIGKGAAPYWMSLDVGTILPPGVTYTPYFYWEDDGEPAACAHFGGSPTTVGIYPIKLIFSDATGTTLRHSVQIKVVPPLEVVTQDLPVLISGSSFNMPLTALGGSGGNTWRLVAGALPPGLTLSASGVLSGTPTTSAVSSFTLEVTDSMGQTHENSFVVETVSASAVDNDPNGPPPIFSVEVRFRNITFAYQPGRTVDSLQSRYGNESTELQQLQMDGWNQVGNDDPNYTWKVEKMFEITLPANHLYKANGESLLTSDEIETIISDNKERPKLTTLMRPLDNAQFTSGGLSSGEGRPRSYGFETGRWVDIRVKANKQVKEETTIGFLVEHVSDDNPPEKTYKTVAVTIAQNGTTSTRGGTKSGSIRLAPGSGTDTASRFTIQRDLDAPNNTWVPVLSQNAKALPGQLMNLKLLTPTGRTISNVEWILPEKTFKDYVYQDMLGRLDPMQPSDLNQQEVHFYFASPGSKTVKVRFSVDGKPAETSVTLTVEEPVATLTAAEGSSNVGINEDYHPTYMFLQVRPAVEFSGSVTIPNTYSGPGEWCFEQLVTPKSTAIREGQEVKQTVGTYRDGGRFPYAGPFATGGGGTTRDGPFIPLHSTYSEATADMTFDMYLLFKPPGEASRHVPLRRLHWSWKDKAVKDGVWRKVHIQGVQKPNDSVKESTHPQWSDKSENHVELE